VENLFIQLLEKGGVPALLLFLILRNEMRRKAAVRQGPVSPDREVLGRLGAQMEELLRLVQATDEASRDRHLSVMREMAATQRQVETGYQSLTRQVDTYRAEVQRLAAS